MSVTYVCTLKMAQEKWYINTDPIFALNWYNSVYKRGQYLYIIFPVWVIQPGLSLLWIIQNDVKTTNARLLSM